VLEQPKIPPATTAVVMNDMINANLVSANPQTQQIIDDSRIVEQSAKLVTAARARGMRIIWIRVERRADLADVMVPITDLFVADGLKLPPAITAGSFEAAPPPQLPAQPEDLIVYKPRFDPFIGTNLELLLHGNSITTLLLGGVATNFGVESCARTARDLGFSVVLLSDCSLNVNREMHDFSLTHIMPRFARVMTSEQAISLLA
jgi:nicotinamidase-related amidase